MRDAAADLGVAAVTNPAGNDSALATVLDQQVRALGLQDPAPPEIAETIAARRRRRGAPRGSPQATVSLVRVDGVLRWTYHRPPRAVGPRRARRASGGLVRGEVVHSFGFQEVPPNQVVAKLEALDLKLTPDRGLRRWTGGKLVPVTALDPTPKALLIIHGTFSKSDVIIEELLTSKEGRAFLQKAEADYQQVLTFDHPTLSISPVLNALDLERALAGYQGAIDVVCHSRGGLVAAWWMKLGARNVRSVVFVASPLEGTSLAAPARLKESLDVLANIAEAGSKMAQAGTVVPWAGPLLGVAAGLMQVLGGVLSVGARTPLLDAGVAVVAGLAAQSRVQNNQELLRLHADAWPTTPKFFGVISDFEPGNPDESWWQFWKKLRNPGVRLANTVADPIFAGPNDLVVDGSSMTRVVSQPFPTAQIWDFGTNNRVHHCNYFAQPETATFLSKTLL
jgi:pimeloyl-ACP methyl ester carboxylesterase